MGLPSAVGSCRREYSHFLAKLGMGQPHRRRNTQKGVLAKVAKLLSARQAGEKMNLPHREVIRRIRKHDIKARKVGWNWMLLESDVDDAMQSDWYKRTYGAR